MFTDTGNSLAKLRQIKEAREKGAHACQERANREFQLGLLKSRFQSARHDPEFLGALTEMFDTIHARRAADPNQGQGFLSSSAVNELATNLQKYEKNPDTAPADYKPLLKLLPAYRQMAKEAAANPDAWQKDTQRWTKRVAELRNANAADQPDAPEQHSLHRAYVRRSAPNGEGRF